MSCLQGNQVSLNVITAMGTNCYDLESMIGVIKTTNSCGRNSVKLSKCEVTTAAEETSNTMCSLNCECDGSMDSCIIQLYPHVKPITLQICEIEVIY